MQHILIPTDFSSNALNAAHYAVLLMKDEPSIFYLLNTFQITAHHPEYLTQENTGTSVMEYAFENSKKGLKQLEETLKLEHKNPLHTFKKISTTGLLTDVIENYIKKKNIELIVMGTQGVTAEANRFIGSNMLETIKQVDCPVIAVPESYKNKVPKQLLLSTDLGEQTQNPFLQNLRAIANLHQATINILKVNKEKQLSDECVANMNHLETVFKDQSCVFHLVESKSVLSEIERFDNENKIDLLVMINNKRSFFKSLLSTPIVNKMVLHTKLPLLVLPSSVQHKGSAKKEENTSKQH